MMTSRLVANFVVCFCCFVLLPRWSTATDDVSFDVIRARCRVRCFSLMQMRQQQQQQQQRLRSGVDAADDDRLPTATLTTLFDECRRDTACLTCVMPCDVDARHCDVICTNTNSHGLNDCHDSCRFLRQVTSLRPGVCPANTARRATSQCTRLCGSDVDCADGEKCCAEGCSWHCVPTLQLQDATPDIPELLSITERSDIDAVQLRWNCLPANVTAPVLYVVQAQSTTRSVDLRPLNAEQTPTTWQQVAETSLCSATVKQLKLSLSYRFRLMAVNIYGARGVSNATKEFILSREPRRPGAPVNLTEGDTLFENGKVAVTIHWLAAPVVDIPVSRYKIFWSQKLLSTAPQVESLHEYRQMLTADQLSFQIPDLEPATTYFIQVQSISHYGETRLKSEKSQLYITTVNFQNEDIQDATLSVSSSSPRPGTYQQFEDEPQDGTGIIVGTPYFQNGLLKANVSWSQFNNNQVSDESLMSYRIFWAPQSCASDKAILDEIPTLTMSATTQDQYFVIYDMLFDCRYTVRVESMSPSGEGSVVARVTIATPPCSQVTVVGGVRPDCPIIVLHPPEAPQNLRHSFIITSNNITVHLKWDPPSDVTGYQVTWGRAGQRWQIDRSTTISRLLPKDAISLNIDGLFEATSYVVRIMGLSGASSGRPATARFTTPQLQAAVANRGPTLRTTTTAPPVIPRPDHSVPDYGRDKDSFDNTNGDVVIQRYTGSDTDPLDSSDHDLQDDDYSPSTDQFWVDIRKLDRRKQDDVVWSAYSDGLVVTGIDSSKDHAEYLNNSSRASVATYRFFHFIIVIVFALVFEMLCLLPNFA